MKIIGRQFWGLVGLLFCSILCLGSIARADSALVADEPQEVQQTAKYRLQVQDDGFARFRVKLSANTIPDRSVNFSLSPFQAAGQSVTLGFGASNQGAASIVASLQNVAVSTEGTEILLAGSALAADVPYEGELRATTAEHQTLIWGITLIRPSAIAPFRCPTGPQVVNADGSTDIEFQRIAPLSEKVIGLRLSAFSSREQELGQIGFITDDKQQLPREISGFALGSQTAIPPIRAVSLTEGSTYTGKIWFVAGGRDLMECSLDLLMPKLPRGELMTDGQSLTSTVMLPMMRGEPTPTPTLSVRLYEKTRSHRIDGVTVTLDGVTESPEGTFELQKHVAFFLNGATIPDLTQLQLPIQDQPQRAARTLQPQEQINVKMEFKDLSPGKYAFALRFAGANTAAMSPKLDVLVNVKDDWRWAVIAMLVALGLSFFITKGIVNWRERTRIIGRIKAMRSEQFDEHADLPSVVFMYAVLDETKKMLSGLWILAAPPSVNDYLARAERVLTILRRYSAVSRNVETALCPDPVKSAFKKQIAEIIHRIGPGVLDQKMTDGIIADLAATESHLSDPVTWHWTKLQSDAKILCQQVESFEATLAHRNPQGHGGVADLFKCLKTPPAEWTQTFDQTYWIVRLLYSRRTLSQELDDLITVYDDKHDLDAMLLKSDQLVWIRLGKAIEGDQVRIEPVDMVQALECLRPIKFKLQFDDQVLAESYFILNVAKYKWTLRMTEARLSWRQSLYQLANSYYRKLASKEAQATLPFERKNTVNGPRITQYVPTAGKLEVSAGILAPSNLFPDCKGGSSELEIKRKYAVDIKQNSEVGVLRNLDGSESLLLVIVTIVTLVTGLPALYFSKANFGSFADYVAILAWAIGIDQGKNLIQLLKAFPADGAAPAPASSP